MLGGMDLRITDSDGNTVHYPFPDGKEFGDAVVHVKTAPSVPLNVGSSTPAQAGGQYDVRDAEGGKSIAHLNWNLGAGQKSLDVEDASPFMFLSSSYADIETPGEFKLLRDVEMDEKVKITGPMFSAVGYVYAAKQGGGCYFSADSGTTWSEATWTGGTPSVAISDFTSDGTFVYSCIASGASAGVWKGTFTGGALNFAKIGASSSETISKIAFNAGYFFGAVDYVSGTSDAKVAMLDSSNSYALSTTSVTPSLLKYCTSVALCSAGNAVYWTVSQGNMSYVYKLSFDPDAGTMMTTQYSEFPEGFVATCAVGYLSTLYVGGYFTTSYSGVGQGALYMCNDGYSSPLLLLGDKPENTPDPDAIENDNRIYSITSGSKDIYFSTSRAVYRWDIDDGGYSHLCDLSSSATGSTTITWTDGTAYSWNAEDWTTPSPDSHQKYPTDWSVSGTGTWTFSGGLANLSTSTVDVVLNPTGADAMGTAITTTAKFGFGPDNAGDTFIQWESGNYRYLISILPSENKVKVHQYLVWYKWTYHAEFENPSEAWKKTTGTSYSWTGYGSQPTPLYLGDPEPADHTYFYTLYSGSSYSVAFTNEAAWPTSWETAPDPGDTIESVSISCTGSTMTVTVNDKLSGITATGQYSSANTGIDWTFDPGVELDYFLLNGVTPVAPVGQEETLTSSGMAFHKGSIFAPYSVPSFASTKSVTSSSSSTERVYIPAHGYSTSDVVTIVGHTGSTPDINGSHTITKYDNDYITLNDVSNITVGGTGGYSYKTGQCKEGFTHLTSTYADSGHIVQSETNFHTGTMPKDFRSVNVGHDIIPGGSTIGCTVWIDGVEYELTGETHDKHTIFPINRQGFAVKLKTTITPSTTSAYTPVIRSINVMWDFVKTRRHSYIVDCRAGVKSGRWRQDPTTAIEFIFNTADKRATFEDAFVGEYTGTIDDVQFLKAPTSVAEGPSGIVKLTVREEV